MQTPTDPLLFLEYQSSVFPCLSGLYSHWRAACSVAVLFKFFARSMTWREFTWRVWRAMPTPTVYWTPGTSYGTQLFWPFSNVRVAWNNSSIVDPLFTLPLVGLAATAAFSASAILLSQQWCGRWVTWAFGWLQQERAMAVVKLKR